jgi:biopolymer transport protein ExbB
MRRYSTSFFRVGLLAIMLLAVALLANTGFAQTRPATPSGSTETVHLNLLQLILGHLDFVFFTIFILSIVGLALIIQGFIKNRESVMMPRESTEKIKSLIQQRRWQELEDFTGSDPSFVSRSLNPALKRAPSFAAMREALETSVSEQTAEQFRQIEYLNIIGNLGPLLGLLGTVLGMIEAFQAMNQAQGQANPAQLAGGISTALTHTFLGLLLAVPCLAAFGVLRTMVDRLTNRGAQIAEDMLLLLRDVQSPSSKEPVEAIA